MQSAETIAYIAGLGMIVDGRQKHQVSALPTVESIDRYRSVGSPAYGGRYRRGMVGLEDSVDKLCDSLREDRIHMVPEPQRTEDAIGIPACASR